MSEQLGIHVYSKKNQPRAYIIRGSVLIEIITEVLNCTPQKNKHFFKRIKCPTKELRITAATCSFIHLVNFNDAKSPKLTFFNTELLNMNPAGHFKITTPTVTSALGKTLTYILVQQQYSYLLPLVIFLQPQIQNLFLFNHEISTVTV